VLSTPSDAVGTLHKIKHNALTGMAIAVNFIIQATAKGCAAWHLTKFKMQGFTTKLISIKSTFG